MTTFSMLVDEIAEESRRPDMLLDLAGWLNDTLREVHFHPSDSRRLTYTASMLETEFTVPDSNPYLWQVPSTARFQSVEAIYNMSAGKYYTERRPRTVYLPGVVIDKPESELYWYRTGEHLTLAGHLPGSSVLVAWYEYPRTFMYIAKGNRPVEYDPNTETYTGTEAELAMETHWLITRWKSVLSYGTRAKMHARMGEDGRSRLAFSSYQTGLLALVNAESVTQGG